ncbi:hypothetical protein EMIHUDRAFT_470727 [Emiliania huxleyi CCMP1516]|uniref:Sodium/calcium exchanger membrane region domain-containing protein n=2 Tax=Emiliania huxleyi TaxID=2903 RepID=A0A0D3IQ42_EMIH1|nr:hypothetical protein EMIHUDRAFT_470727 [Emiliania huxleyi CCMP1516]EOD13377.1 hypothetical protein EMIHUDRAFT_470727 [Emiliania huxleyi CCMP1516]|eukprot:XP_005765806.1 hypothetical protein EMIHUDRAFT_470727 [Emiliania huxleyi CCMP1516]
MPRDVAGATLMAVNIPGIVMGTIVLSSGTSVPDSLSSMVVARKGEGDMAVASAIANVLGVQRAGRPPPPPCLGHKSTTHNAPAQTLAITKFPVLCDFSFCILSVILLFFLFFVASTRRSSGTSSRTLGKTRDVEPPVVLCDRPEGDVISRVNWDPLGPRLSFGNVAQRRERTVGLALAWALRVGGLEQGCRVQSTRVGCILNIPGIVMCTIVLSSGTSVPDSLSSIVVARKGEGDMAIAIANTLAITKFPVLCDFSFCILSVILLFFLFFVALDQKIVRHEFQARTALPTWMG